MMEMPKPTDAHRTMHQFAGKWAGEEKMYPSMWDPQGGTAVARMDSRVGLEGFVVIGDYEQERGGCICFRGHSVFTYDDNRKCYAMYWFDSMMGKMEEFTGNFDGGKLVMTSKNPMGFARLTYTFPSEGALASKMEMSQDGQTWKTFFDGTYTRKG